MDAKKESEEDVEYSDDEESEDELLEAAENDAKYAMIEEKNQLFGASVHDMINIFGVCCLAEQKICGINAKNMYYKNKDAIIDYLMKFLCDAEDDGALEIVFLGDTNTLNYTGYFVKGVNTDELENLYKAKNIKDSDYNKGDVKTRSQAK